MIHWPTWRPPGGDPIRTPATRKNASVTSGPSIHGIGVWIRLQIHPASPPTATPALPCSQRARGRAIIDDPPDASLRAASPRGGDRLGAALRRSFADAKS